jgi:hypothetical protein
MDQFDLAPEQPALRIDLLRPDLISDQGSFAAGR